MGQNLKNYPAGLNQISESVSKVTEDDLMRKLFDLLGKLMPVDSFYFGNYDRENKTLDWIFLLENAKSLDTASEAVPEILKEMMIKHECLIINPDKAVNTESILCKNNHEVQSILVSPVFNGDEASGVVALKSRSRNYNQEDAHLLAITCSLLGMSKFEQDKFDRLMEEKDHLQSVVELAGSVGHELNQPLTGIAGYCALIKEDIDQTDPIYKDIEQIEKQAVRLERLVYKFQSIVDLEKRKSPGK